MSIELQSGITRENLRVLMTSFYEKAMLDQVLGPFFINELGDDIENEEWEEHIELLADFWLAKLMGHKTYGGNFVGAHVTVPDISRESFVKWLELFSTTADEVYVPEVAEQFKTKGLQLSKEFLANKLNI